MGTVYLAHDPVLDRPVAVKVLRADAVGSQTTRLRMVREARVMAKLAHPNVVTVFDAGESDDTIYIVMEVVSGGTLSEWLKGAKRPWAEVVERFARAGAGLAAAHAVGIVHRDFKPSNVLVEADGRVVVTDFGIASSSEGDFAFGDATTPRLQGHLTRTGAMMGTPAYMSPEQHAGRRTDASTDQFSFAVALFEGVFGVSPFAGESYEARRDAVLGGRLRGLDWEQQRSVPEGIQRVIFRALAQDPAARYPSMTALLADLVARPAPPPPAKKSSMPMVAGLGVASVVVALAAVLVIRFAFAAENPRFTALDDDAVVRARVGAAGYVVVSTFESPDATHGVSGRLRVYTLRDPKGADAYVYVFRAPPKNASVFVESTSALCASRKDVVATTAAHVVCAGSINGPTDKQKLLDAVLR